MNLPVLRPTIHSAIIDNQSYEIIQKLLDQGTNPNTLDSRNNTALHFAVEHNREDVVELLLSYKTHVNFQNCNGDTPLHWAVYTNADDDIVVNLVLSGASPHIRNSDGLSSLDLAHNACDIKILALVTECLDASLG